MYTSPEAFALRTELQVGIGRCVVELLEFGDLGMGQGW